MNKLLTPTLENVDIIEGAIKLSNMYDTILDFLCEYHNSDCDWCPLKGRCGQTPTKEDILVVLCWLMATSEKIEEFSRALEELCDE